MNPLEAYKHCPKCGNALHRSLSENFLKCLFCKYDFFVNPAPCASVIIVLNKKVLLSKRKYEPYKGTWQTPGGFMKIGEDVERAIKREIEEELGIQIKLGQYITSLQDSYPYYDVDLPFVALYFYAEPLSFDLKANDDASEIGFFSREEIAKMEITYEPLRDLLLTIKL